MKIATKFNVGDEVYVCKNDSEYKQEICITCEGKGFIDIKNENFKCPKCYGNKYTNKKIVKGYDLEKRIIRKIRVFVSNNNGNIQIHIRYETKPNGCGSIEEDKNIIFSTKKEAEDRCKELNGENIILPDFMTVKEFADKINVRSQEMIKWLFLCGKIVSNNSAIGFEDMKEFADKYGFICEREVEE